MHTRLAQTELDCGHTAAPSSTASHCIGSTRSLIFPSLYPSHMTHFLFPPLRYDSLFVVAAPRPPDVTSVQVLRVHLPFSSVQLRRAPFLADVQRPTSCFAPSIRHPRVLQVLFLNLSSSLLFVSEGDGGGKKRPRIEVAASDAAALSSPWRTWSFSAEVLPRPLLPHFTQSVREVFLAFIGTREVFVVPVIFMRWRAV